MNFARIATVAALIATPVALHAAQASASPPAIVGAASTGDDGGYYTFSSDGGVQTYGDAHNQGSLPGLGIVPTHPVSGGTVDPATGGYWEVATDGGVFSFNAPYYGSTGGIVLNKPIVGMASTPDGGGYWFVASDGGVFSFGDAGFYGSLGATQLVSPIVGMAVTPSGHGYWLVDRAGHVYTFGDATFLGNATFGSTPVVGIATDYTGHGYAVEDVAGATDLIGDAATSTDGFVPPSVVASGHITEGVIASSDGKFWSVDNAGAAWSMQDTAWQATFGSPSDYVFAETLPNGTPARWACSSYPISVYYNPAGQVAQPNLTSDLSKLSEAMGIPFVQTSNPDADITVGWVPSFSPIPGVTLQIQGETTPFYNGSAISAIVIQLSEQVPPSPMFATDLLLHELAHEGLNDDPATVTGEELGPQSQANQTLEGRFGAGDLAGLHLVGSGSPCL